MDSYKYDVSIVIPVYNTEDYIRECVDSIMNQKTDISKIEVLLINDGSTDNSAKICEEIENKYNNVKYIYKDNSGVSDTRNCGIKRAQGKYIMLLDSDDYLSDNTIKNLVSFFDKHYTEVDLVTYPIYWDREGKISLHSRYSETKYDKGTGIYDLDQYPHLNQSTVNIIFKNEFEHNQLYDTSMKLSEDQNYNTSLLMKKNKLGYVVDAVYYYRRHGASVSQTRNNPYYCFEDIMSYNEGLLEKYNVNGKIPKYIQTLVVNTLGWRVKQDELLPYHYKGDNFVQAKNRVTNILKKIDDDVIINHSSFDVYTKLFFMKNKESQINSEIKKGKYIIFSSTEDLIYEGDAVNCHLYRTRMVNGKIELFASFADPILELFEPEQYIVEGIKKDGTHFREICAFSNTNIPFRNTKMPTAHSYFLTYQFNPEEVKKLKLKIEVNHIEYDAKILYIKYCGFINKYRKNEIELGDYRISYHNKCNEFKIAKRSTLKNFINEIKSIPSYPKKKLFAILYYRNLTNTKRNIWLYSDSAGVIDNAYYQFIHDFNKNDGVERYYVVDGDTSYLNGKLTSEQRKYIVKHKSKKHKELFLQSNKVIISFSSVSIYSPFKDLKWYIDKLHYELVYLQHGILHASLQRMYSKEYTQIDKFIISSDFEKNNLIQNYNYSETDLIVSGMPRMGLKKESVNVKNKILLAPSWRQYLIGYLVNNRRALKEEEFLNSDFYKEINAFIHSSSLQKLLTENNLELDFQLHPIFKAYKDHFHIEEVPHVSMNFEKANLEEYKLFITDFSSYQFDFVQLNRPIIYFLPDEAEFKAGLHSYKSLDLKYEDAFGKLCLTSESLLNEMKNIINCDFEVAEPYKSRMESFFTIANEPCEKIYESIIKN